MIIIMGIFLVITAIILFPSQLGVNKEQLKAVEISFDIRQQQLKADYQFRRKELIRRHKAEDITAEAMSQLIDELDQETSSSLDSAIAKQSSSKISKSISLASLLVVVIVVIAGNSYWLFGNPELAEEKSRLLELMEQNPASIDYLTQQASTQKTQQAFLELLHAARLQIELRPLDPKSWYQFSEVEALLGRNELAIQALRQARKLDPKNNQIKLALSKILMGEKQHASSKEAMRLDKEVLNEQPDNEEALLGLGFSAFTAENYELAIKSWQKVLNNRDPDSEGAILLNRSIQTARVKLAAANSTRQQPSSETPLQQGRLDGTMVTVSVEIPDEIKRQLKGNETLFVFARAASGPPMPLAAVRYPVNDYPSSIQLSDKDAMRPELKLSGFEQIQLVARISLTGTAIAQKGDFEGKSKVLNAPFTGKTFTINVNQQR